MAAPRRSSSAPWITAGVVGVVLAALLAVLFAVLIPARNDNHVGQLSSKEKQVVTAASTEALNLLSYRRASFDADYKRAVDGTTGALAKDVSARKATTLKTLTTGKFDLAAKLLHTGLVGPAGGSASSGYTVLVTVSGYKTTEPNAPSVQNLQVTVVPVKGSWLASDVKLIEVS